MKHNNIIFSLENRLARINPNRLIETELEYILEDGTEGEADIIVINIAQNYAYGTEVKTNDNYKNRLKADIQLLKDKQYIFEKYGITRVHKFYAYSDDDNGYVIEHVRP